MPDIIENLQKLKPISPDPASILFAAGQASVKPGKIWPTIAGILVITNLITVGFLIYGKAKQPMVILEQESVTLPVTNPKTNQTIEAQPSRESQQTAINNDYGDIANDQTGQNERTTRWKNLTQLELQKVSNTDRTLPRTMDLPYFYKPSQAFDNQSIKKITLLLRD